MPSDYGSFLQVALHGDTQVCIRRYISSDTVLPNHYHVPGDGCDEESVELQVGPLTGGGASFYLPMTVFKALLNGEIVPQKPHAVPVIE